MSELKPDILLEEGDGLGDYGIKANIIALPGYTEGFIGIDVDNAHLIVGDELMNIFYPPCFSGGINSDRLYWIVIDCDKL